MGEITYKPGDVVTYERHDGSKIIYIPEVEA